MVRDYPDYWKPIAWMEQYGDLWPMRDWVAKLGKLKVLVDASYIPAGETETQIEYTVPEGYELYLSSVNQNSEVRGEVQLRFYPGPIIFVSFHRAYTTHSLPLGCSVVAQAGVELRIRYRNADTEGGEMGCYTIGFELGASSSSNPRIEFASQRYKAGRWNYANIRRDREGIATYEFCSIRDPRIFRFKAKNLYTPEEEILEDEEV